MMMLANNGHRHDPIDTPSICSYMISSRVKKFLVKQSFRSFSEFFSWFLLLSNFYCIWNLHNSNYFCNVYVSFEDHELWDFVQILIAFQKYLNITNDYQSIDQLLTPQSTPYYYKSKFSSDIFNWLKENKSIVKYSFSTAEKIRETSN